LINRWKTLKITRFSTRARQSENNKKPLVNTNLLDYQKVNQKSDKQKEVRKFHIDLSTPLSTMGAFEAIFGRKYC
jgi:hypothetical protein